MRQLDDRPEIFDDPEELGGQLEHASLPMVVSRGHAVLAARRLERDQAARRVPYLAVGAAGATGSAAWGLVEAATAAGQPALAGSIAVGTWIATGAGLPLLRLQLRDRTGPDGCTEVRIPHEYRRRWWTAGGAAALWIDAMAAGAASAVGPGVMFALLVGGAATLSARWMRDHDVPQPVDPPPPLAAPPPPPVELPPPAPSSPPPPPPPDEGDLIAELWATRVAAGANPIAPGSTLGDDRVDLPNGYQWIVQLDPDGTVNATRLRERTGDIALKFGTRVTHVAIDHLEGDDQREDRALLTVVTRDILRDGVPYHGPVYHAGKIPLGLYADGSGTPYWTTKDATGPQFGLVIGASGSGKSELLARLGMSYRKSEEWIVLFSDGDERGRSSPLLKRVAYDFGAGPAEVLEQLEGVEAWFRGRGELLGGLTVDADGLPVPMRDPNREVPAGKILPCRRFPGWVWFLDEFHRMVTDPVLQAANFVPRMERVGRVIRKTGGALVVGTQSGQAGDFGNSDVLRSQLTGGNLVILRTTNNNDQYAVGDFGVDPTTLRKGGGYGFVRVEDGRQMMFRGEWSPHMARWAKTLPPYSPDELAAGVYAAKRPPKPADPVLDFEQHQRRLQEIQDALTSGGRLPWEEQPDEAEAEELAQPEGDAPTIWTTGGVSIAQPILGPMFAQGAADAGAAPRALTGAEQAVLARLAAAGGPVRNAQIIADTGLADSTVSKALRALVSAGHAARRGHGLHEVTATGRDAVASVQ